MPPEDRPPPGTVLAPARARDWLRRFALALGFALEADRRRFILLFIAEPAGSLFHVAAIFGLKLLADAAIAQDATGAILAACITAAAGAAMHTCRYAYVDLTLKLGEATQLRLERHLMALAGGAAGLELHERPELADQLALIRDERHQLVWAANNTALVLRLLAEVVGGAILVARVHPALALLPLCGAAPFLASKRATDLAQRARDATTQHHRLRHHLVSLTTDPAASKEVRLLRLQDELIRRHQHVCASIARPTERAALLGALYRLAGLSLFLAGYTAALLLVLWRASAGHASAGNVVLALLLAAQLAGSLGGLVNAGTSLLRTLVICGRYLWLRDLSSARLHPERAQHPEQSEPPQRGTCALPIPARLTSGITLEGVSFSYPGTDRQVVSDVSLHLPAGSVVGLVGENGAGKTTLVKLLARFYEPTAGQIVVDGVPLAQLDPIAWQARVTATFQDYQRFELLARETVGIGSIPHLNRQDVIAAAVAAAGAAETIQALPNGYETQLGASWDAPDGSKGVDLSGGQWQKLALARALMRHAPLHSALTAPAPPTASAPPTGAPAAPPPGALLLILDEPTAAIDAETEHALFERFAAAAKQARASGAITLLVSHRFSTMRLADQIVVLGGGRVLESGTPAALLAQGGPYAALFTLQARGYS